MGELIDLQTRKVITGPVGGASSLTYSQKVEQTIVAELINEEDEMSAANVQTARYLAYLIESSEILPT